MRARTSFPALLVAGLVSIPFRSTAGNLYVSLDVNERAGIARPAEVITTGVPLPRGRVHAAAELRVLDVASGAPLPAQIAALATWPDGSIRIALVDYLVTMPRGAGRTFALTQDPTVPPPPPVPAPGVSVSATPLRFDVDTGAARFGVPRSGFRLFDAVRVGTTDVVTPPGCELRLDSGGTVWRASADAASTVVLEEAGPLRVVLAASGTFRDTSSSALLRYRARLHFTAGSSAVRVFLTLANDLAAQHPNNVWDLGSPGSRDIEDLSIVVPLAGIPPGPAPTYTLWSEAPAPRTGTLATSAVLYQESSGGNRWSWPTHVNRANAVPLRFRGYELRVDGTTVETGNRPEARIDLSSPAGGVGAAVRHFWQQFPKALRATSPGTLEVALFPAEFPEAHEIQGGEQKTHEVVLRFHEGDAVASGVGDALLGDLTPLRARPAYAAVARSEGLSRFGPRDNGAFPRYENTIAYMAFARGDRSFFTQREEIDEYGWRDFGEVFADHETDCGTQCWDCPVSHDNNQYDYAWATLLLWIRNGEPEWLDLGEQALRHMGDIDVYHTSLDTPAYNGGLFWHTTHDTNAYTATHRTYSSRMSSACTPFLSGGPAPGHLYTDGLLTLGWLTGDRRALEVHAELEAYLVARYGLDAPAPGSGYEPRAWANALRTAVGACRRDAASAACTLAPRIVADSAADLNPAIDGTSFGDSMLMVSLGRFLDLEQERGTPFSPDAIAARTSLTRYAERVQANHAPQSDVLDFRFAEGLWAAWRHALPPGRMQWPALARSYFTAGEATSFFDAYITCKGEAHTATNGQLHAYYERGVVPAEVQALHAVKQNNTNVALSWQAVAADVDQDPVTVGAYAVHRATLRATHFTDQPIASVALPAYVVPVDVTAIEPLIFYEVHAVATPGLEGY